MGQVQKNVWATWGCQAGGLVSSWIVWGFKTHCVFVYINGSFPLQFFILGLSSSIATGTKKKSTEKYDTLF